MDLSSQASSPAQAKPKAAGRLSTFRGKALAGLGAIVIVTAGVAAWSYWSPWLALDQLKRALASRDVAELSASIDWKATRDKLVIKLAGDALRASGLAPGDERISTVILAVEAAVDKMATPESLAKLLEQAGGPEAKMVVRGEYLNMGVFVFAIRNSSTGGAISLSMRRLGPVSWIVDEMIFIDARQLGMP